MPPCHRCCLVARFPPLHRPRWCRYTWTPTWQAGGGPCRSHRASATPTRSPAARRSRRARSIAVMPDPPSRARGERSAAFRRDAPELFGHTSSMRGPVPRHTREITWSDHLVYGSSAECGAQGWSRTRVWWGRCTPRRNRTSLGRRWRITTVVALLSLLRARVLTSIRPTAGLRAANVV